MKHLFRILGLRAFTPEGISRSAIRDVQCMQKALYGRKNWLYFYEGVSIKDDSVSLEEGFADDQVLFNTNRVC